MADPLTGAYITTDRVSKGLVLTLTDAGREELEAYRDGEFADIVSFTKPHAEIWTALLEDLEECRDLHMLADSEYEMLGAMTSSPIFVTLPAYNDERELTAFDAAFWFPNYQIESELETLLVKGSVTFDLASEPQDLNICECGYETYIVERAHDHQCEKASEHHDHRTRRTQRRTVSSVRM